MTVDELLNRITSDEFLDWQAYYTLEPFGEPWRQTAQVCAMIGNAAGGKKGGGSFTPSEFLPVRPLLTTGVKRQTGEQMLAIFRAMADTTKGKQ